jgi:uncharacterized membrane protein YczE
MSRERERRAADSDAMRRVWHSTTRWAVGRAWSRAGAVAQVLSTGPARRVLGWTTALALVLAGSVAVAAGVALLFWTDLGPGPLDVFAAAVRDRFEIPLAIVLWSLSAILIVVATVLGRRPGPATLIAPFVVGGLVDVFVGLTDQVDRPGAIAARAAIHLAAVGVAGLGAGMLICSGLGAGTGELFAAATSDRTGRSEPGVRFVIEASWVVLGVALGGPIGLGTAIVMVAIGPAVASGHAVVDGRLAASRRFVGRLSALAARADRGARSGTSARAVPASRA